MLLCAWLLWTATWLSNEGVATQTVISGRAMHGQVASWTSLGWVRAQQAGGVAYYERRMDCENRARELRHASPKIRIDTRCVPAGEKPQP